MIASFIGRNTDAPANNGGPDSMVGVDAALDYPLYNTLTPTVKAQLPPTSVAQMYNLRKQIEGDILSSQGDATRFFVTFLDNHDMKARIRYVEPSNPTHFDSQVTLGLACLCSLPGIPCIYYGTEQGLHGAGSDPAVREALWGLFPSFPQDSFFYQQIANISAVRASQPALRYARFYFRPLSGDGVHYGLSPYLGGVMAWSRILNDQEVVIVANTNTTQPQTLHLIIDSSLNSPGAQPTLLYSNQPTPTPPCPATAVAHAVVTEVDGSTGYGPLVTIQVTLAPMEVQVLRT